MSTVKTAAKSGAPAAKGNLGKRSRGRKSEGGAPPPKKAPEGLPAMEVDEEAPPADSWRFVGKNLANSGFANLVAFFQSWAQRLTVDTFCMAMCLLGSDRSNEAVLVSLVAKALKPGTWPRVTNQGPWFLFDRGENTVLEDPAGGYRSIGADTVVFGTPLSFWPPTLGSGANAACAWTIHKPGWTREEAVAWLEEAGGEGPRAIFREFTKDGTPTNHFVLRVEGFPRETGADFEQGGITAKFVNSCSFCCKGGPFAGKHSVFQCPIRSMMNKVRAQQSLAEVGCGDDSFDFDTGVADFDAKAVIAKLELRVEALEKALKALQEKPKETAVARPDKRKAGAPEGGRAKRAKDSSGEGPSGGSGKGKGKAKA
ncbi:hypothetical protein FRC08_002958 [Ceratobasidium sp. 394]|nr:hypothetical protein FRC08_002958 [Ceratobasidium sp. 394]